MSGPTARALPALGLLAAVAALWAAGLLPVTAPEARCGGYEQLLPGLGRQDGAPATTLFTAPSPPAGRNLAVQALQPSRMPRAGPSHAGLVVLLLLLYACAAGLLGTERFGSLAAWSTWRRTANVLAVVVGLVLLAAPDLGTPAAWAYAAWALSTLSPPAAARADPVPALLLGACAVVLAASAAGVALHAGSTTDAALLEPLLSRLDDASRHAVSPELLERNAAHLRAVLDRTALAAFAAMATLLVHLKARRPATGLLVVAALVFDLLSVARR